MTASGTGTRVISGKDLQNKSDRPYFRHGMGLKRGEISISPIELNQEFGKIESPQVPVVRGITPVYVAGEDVPSGLVVINAFARPLLDAAVSGDAVGGGLIVIDQDGRYVSHPDPAKAFAHEFGSSATYFDENRDIADDLMRHDSYSVHDKAMRQLRSWRKVRYDPHDQSGYYVIVSRIDDSQLYGQIDEIVGNLASSTAVVLALAVILALMVGRRISGPITSLRDAALALAVGRKAVKIKTGLAREIAELIEVFQTMAIEIDEKRESLERRVEERTRELNVLLENLPVGVVIADKPDGHLRMINSIGKAMLGRGAVSDVGPGQYSTAYHVERENGQEYRSEELPLAVTLSTGKPDSKNDLFVRRPDGKRINLRVVSAPIFDVAGNFRSAVAVFEDWSYEFDFNRRKDEFISFVTHQLKTPPVAISWMTELLLGGEVGKLNAKQRSMVDDLRRVGMKMNETVTLFLNISRAELGSFRVDTKTSRIDRIVRDVKKELAAQISAKRISFAVKAERDVPALKLDAELFSMIIQNLISNALKYTPDKGSVEVAIKSSADGGALIEVRDSGIGIPKEAQARIFERMFRASNVGAIEGTGFGLYLCKLIADASGLMLSFESAEGLGTTFRLAIPKSGMKSKTGTTRLA